VVVRSGVWCAVVVVHGGAWCAVVVVRVVRGAWKLSRGQCNMQYAEHEVTAWKLSHGQCNMQSTW